MTRLTEADRHQIVEVVRRADEFATARDVDGYLALTTADMVLDGDQGTSCGSHEVRTAVGTIWAAEPPGTRHLTGDIRITAGDDATAHAYSTLSLADAGPATPTVWAVTSITQLLRKTDRGWLIAHRTVGTVIDSART